MQQQVEQQHVKTVLLVAILEQGQEVVLHAKQERFLQLQKVHPVQHVPMENIQKQEQLVVHLVHQHVPMIVQRHLVYVIVVTKVMVIQMVNVTNVKLDIFQKVIKIHVKYVQQEVIQQKDLEVVQNVQQDIIKDHLVNHHVFLVQVENIHQQQEQHHVRHVQEVVMDIV